MADGLIYPGTDPEPILEFRDCMRPVPNHLLPFLQQLETHRLTYNEAVDAANRKMEADHINAQHAAFVSAFFRELR